MEIAIVGSGSMGSLFGGLLGDSGHDVIFIDMWEEHIEALNESGLTFVDPDGKSHTIEATATTDPESVGEVDLVMPFVKCYHTEAAISDATSIIGPSTTVVTLQNGLTNPDIIAEYVDKEQVIAGITTMSAQIKGPGRVVHRDVGKTVIGRYFEEHNSEVKQLAERLSGDVLEIEVSETIRDIMWEKVLVNVTYNPITALSQVRVGDIIDDPAGRALVESIVEETERVAQAQGRTIRDDAVEYVLDVGEEHRSHKTSMRHDLENEQKTEIEYMNGAIAKFADEKEVEAPFNRMLTNLVKLAEQRNDGSK